MGKLIPSIVMLAMLTMPAMCLNQAPSIGKLVYMTDEYPPFNFQEGGELKGISVDLLEKTLNRMDCDLNRSDIELLPWYQGYQAVLEDNNSVFFSVPRLPGWEALFKWVGPISPTQTVIFAMDERAVKISSPAEMNRYRIGVVRGSAEQQLLTSLGVNAKSLVLEDNPNAIVKKLKSGSIDVDAFAYSEMPGIWLFNKSGIISKDYDIAYDLKDEVELYYAFNKETPDSVVFAFQCALNQTKQEKGIEGTSDYDKILYKYLPVRYINQNVTDEQVVSLVKKASEDIERDARGTLDKISAGEHPYKDEDNPELYVYVYDTNVTFVAHADNPTLNGFDFKGKTDASGKKFADETVRAALENGNGWVDYIWTNPAKSGLYYKTAYYKLTRGSDGKLYIVCAGKYKAK